MIYSKGSLMLVVAGLLGQAGEGVAQVGTGMAEPLASQVQPSTARIAARVTGSASLRRGVMPTGGRHGARPGCSIGDSTRAEIAYARSLGKPVRFTHPEVDPDA
jgi:hypothetical protein